MPWGLVATAVVGAYTADQQGKAGEKSADAQRDASQASIDEQRRQYDLTRQDQMPWLQAGQGALGQMQQLNSGDFSSFKESPDYQFSFNEGQRALDQGAASRGGLFGGGNTRDTVKYGQGMASQQYNSFYNKLQSMAGQGQTTGAGLGQLGAGMANQIGAQYNNIGNARSSAYQNSANVNSQYAAGLGGLFNNWYQQNSANNGGGSGWYLGNNPGRG